MVCDCHRPEERNKVQAFNDFLIFGSMAIGSFISGSMLAHFGWYLVNVVMFPVVGIAAAMLAWQAFRERIVDDARQLGDLRPDTDVPLLAFMLHATENAAETEALAFDDPARYELGRRAVRTLLRGVATDPGAVDALV